MLNIEKALWYIEAELKSGLDLGCVRATAIFLRSR